LFRFLRYWLAALLLGLLSVDGNASAVQSAGPPAPMSRTSNVSLAEVVHNLPHYIEPGMGLTYSEAIDNAAPAERDAAVSELIGWLKDERPRVRGLALNSLGFLYMPTTPSSRVITCSRYLPVKDIPIGAAYLRDADSRVRNATLLALSSVENCGHGLDELVVLVLPILREPDILTEYPDPFFVESDERMLANMTPQQQAAFQAQHRPVIKLPAEGPLLLSILAVPTLKPSPAVDDAMVAFLNRPDQTKSTLGESLHTLALSHASERVNDEALRRVFEQKAMTVFLLQFIGQLRLTPEQFSAQKERLIALSKDESKPPALRKAATTVAACWSGDRTFLCQPTSEELSEDSNPTAREKQ
jgi:hypothetical protein